MPIIRLSKAVHGSHAGDMSAAVAAWQLLAVAKLPVRPSEHILHLRQVEGREAHRVGAFCHRENKRGRFSAIDLHRKQGVIAIADRSFVDKLSTLQAVRRMP